MPVKKEERTMERKLKPVETQRFSACLCCRKKKCVKQMRLPETERD